MSYMQHRMGLTATFSRSGSYAHQPIESFTMDALSNVIASIPDWLTRLEHLNGQIDTRQIELAALATLSEYRPPTRSLRPKGSTESLLRPNDGDQPTAQDDKPEVTSNQLPPLTKVTNIPSSSPETASPAGLHSAPPPAHPNPSPIQRRTSQRLNGPKNASQPAYPTVLRKRKTESVVSGESIAPKYRTRSMIIVYYDSAVQLAFEELVRYISASRNAMRKGKMAARMADMKKIAELEVESSDDDEPPSPEKEGTAANGDAVRPTGGAGEKQGTEILKLEFVSTRKMGPSRDSPEGAALRHKSNTNVGHGRRPILQSLRGQSGTTAAGSFASIFDELDSGLEWCQSMCEHAAHQFLRDGTCSVEIDGVRERLAEVKKTAEKELVKVTAVNAAAVEKQRTEESSKVGVAPEDSRGMKQIQMRKPFVPTPPKALEAGHIEVDEGFDEEVEKLPPFRWRSAGQPV